MTELHPKGLKPTPPDLKRHFRAMSVTRAPHELPTRLSYSGIFDQIDDQGPHNTCVAHGSVAIAEAFAWKHAGRRIEMSRRALYYRAKKEYEPSDMTDDGLSVGEGLRVLQRFGYVLESDWTYEGNLFEPVPDTLWHDDFRLAAMVSVDPNAHAIKVGLLTRGPVIIGSAWPGEFEEPGPSGVLPLQATFANADGHCTVIVAYDDGKTGGDWPQPGGFFVRNSWGSSWGSNGYCWLPYDAAAPAIWEAYTVSV